MRQRRSRCPSRLCAPLVTWLGLAVSLSASLAQDVQKLAQVNTAQMMPGPRVGPPVSRSVRPFTGTESPLLQGRPAPRQRPFTGTEPPLLQEGPASRPGEALRPFTGTEPPLLQEGPAGTEPLVLRERPASRPGEGLQRSPDPRPTEAPRQKPAGAGAGPKEALERSPIPPAPLPPLEGLGSSPVRDVGLGVLVLSLGAAAGLWLFKRARATHQKASASVQELLRKALIDPEEVGRLVKSNASAPQDVDVTVFAPPVVPPCEEVIVQVMFHTPDREAEALNRAQKVEAAAQTLAWVPLTIQLRQNDNIKVSVECKDATIPEPVQSTVWNGRLVCLYFRMQMPNVEMVVRPKLRVFVNGVPAGNLVFKTLVQQNPPDLRPSPASETARAYRKAFLSYASEDRVEVLKRAQMLRAAKINFFQDVLSLSPGERWERRLYTEIDNCDLFLLFWSHHALQSEWVIREAEYALERAKAPPGEPEIEPVPLDGPPPPLPPASLKDIHFNDPIRYAIFAEESITSATRAANENK